MQRIPAFGRSGDISLVESNSKRATQRGGGARMGDVKVASVSAVAVAAPASAAVHAAAARADGREAEKPGEKEAHRADERAEEGPEEEEVVEEEEVEEADAKAKHAVESAVTERGGEQHIECNGSGGDAEETTAEASVAADEAAEAMKYGHTEEHGAETTANASEEPEKPSGATDAAATCAVTVVAVEETVIEASSSAEAITPLTTAVEGDDAPMEARAHRKRSRSPEAAAVEVIDVSSVEDESPEIVCIESDEEETAASEASALDESNEPVAHSGSARRQRKRARVLGFSSTKSRMAKLKRQSLAIATEERAAAAVDPAPSTSRVRRQHSAESVAEPVEAPVDATAPSTSGEVAAWDWKFCRPYCDPLTQTNMDDLARARREAASIVSANSHVWHQMRRFDNDGTYLASMGADAKEDAEHLRVRPLRRGRYYREVWEEEDFLITQRKTCAAGKSSKKRPFAGCELLRSARNLVRGYDDALFDNYIRHLEERVPRQAEGKSRTAKNGHTPAHIDDGPRRSRNAARRVMESDGLPPVPVQELHPASSGGWKLKGKSEPCFDTIHPAAIRSDSTRQRWREEFEQEAQDVDIATAGLRRSTRRDTKQEGEEAGDEDGDAEEKRPVEVSDEAEELPSFGAAIEEDEISRDLNQSLLRLVEVSAQNWSRAQLVYERAVTHIEVAPLLEAEHAVQVRLENLYRKLFPPVAGEEDDEPKECQLKSRPRDLVAYAVKPCSDLQESVAVAASVECALRLKKGDAVDVLDRNACWNDGVVTDLFLEGGQGIKYVLISYALWGDDACEWIDIMDGRLLPRGVADGRAVFSLPPSRLRKRPVNLDKALADVLQRTFPGRRSAHAKTSDEPARVPSKKQRRH